MSFSGLETRAGANRDHRLRSVQLVRSTVNFKETKRISLEDGHKQLNQYVLFETIGRGAYGKVKRALNTEDDTFYAAKIYDKKTLRRKRVGQFGNALQGVAKEIAIWKRLNHRNVVTLHEFIDSDNSQKIYMISEFVDGGPVVEDEIKCSALPETKCKDYFAQLIQGLSYLHFHKTIHRDIKPGNLILGSDGVLKITDFGVSHMFEGEDDLIRATAGTAPFLAPEVLNTGHFKGRPVDVWAAGITLYMFVYGSAPFVTSTLPVLYNQIRDNPIEFRATSGGLAVNPQLIDLLQHVLNKNPEERYTIEQIKAHPWMQDEMEYSAENGQEFTAIEVEEHEISSAITQVSFLGIVVARRAVKSFLNLTGKQRVIPIGTLPMLKANSDCRLNGKKSPLTSPRNNNSAKKGEKRENEIIPPNETLKSDELPILVPIVQRVEQQAPISVEGDAALEKVAPSSPKNSSPSKQNVQHVGLEHIASIPELETIGTSSISQSAPAIEVPSSSESPVSMPAVETIGAIPTSQSAPAVKVPSSSDSTVSMPAVESIGKNSVSQPVVEVSAKTLPEEDSPSLHDVKQDDSETAETNPSLSAKVNDLEISHSSAEKALVAENENASKVENRAPTPPHCSEPTAIVDEP